MRLKALVKSYFLGNELKKVKKLTSVPSVMALFDAAKMLDIEMVRRILEAKGPNRSPPRPKEIKRCIDSLVGRICAPGLTPKLPYLLGDNLPRALDLLKLLLLKYDDPDVGDYRYSGSSHAENNTVNTLLGLIVSENRSEAAWESMVQCLMEQAVSIYKPAEVHENTLPLNEGQADSLSSEVGVEGALREVASEPVQENGHLEVLEIVHEMKPADYGMILLLNAVTTHFNCDEELSFELLSHIAQRVLEPRRLFKVAENVVSLEVLNEDFNEAVRRLDFEEIKKKSDPRFINALIPDETGILRSPLCHALRARRYDLAEWLCQLDYRYQSDYVPFWYPDWLIIEGLPKKMMHTFGGFFGSYMARLFQPFYFPTETIFSIRLFSYFGIHSDLCLDIINRYPGQISNLGLFFEILLSTDLEHKSLLLSCDNLSNSVWYIAGVMEVLVEKLPLERIRERDYYGDNTRPFYNLTTILDNNPNITIEEVKVAVLYLILFNEGGLRYWGTNPQLLENRSHYLAHLSPLTDDLLFDLLSRQVNSVDQTRLIWKEIYDRCRANPNSALWKQVQGYFYNFTIQRNLTKVLREDINTIPAFFIYFRRKNEFIPGKPSLPSLPADVIDLIASFVNPKVKRRKIIPAQPLPLLEAPPADLPIHRAIEQCDISLLNNVDLSTFDTRNSMGLTPLMLCLINLHTIQSRPTWRDEQGKIDNLIAIFDFCLLHADVNRRCTVLFPVKHKVMLSPLQFALCVGLRDCALKLIEHGADVNQPDSNGWLPIVYCHGVYGMNQDKFYTHRYFTLIQLLLAKTKEFNPQTCLALSKAICSASLKNGVSQIIKDGVLQIPRYNPDPIIDGVTEFQKAYSDLITLEHQKASDLIKLERQKAREPKIYEKFTLICREEFKEAVFSLSLEEMKGIYGKLVAENEKNRYASWMNANIKDSKTPALFLDPFANRATSPVLRQPVNDLDLEPGPPSPRFFGAPAQQEVPCSLLAYALKKGRSDIFFWLVEAGWDLLLSDDWLPETNEMPVEELKRVAQLYAPKHKFMKISHFPVYRCGALFYEVISLLYQEYKNSPTNNSVSSEPPEVHSNSSIRQAALRLRAINQRLSPAARARGEGLDTRSDPAISSVSGNDHDPELLLQNAAAFVIYNPDVFDDQEVNKRVAFLIGLQPYIAHFIEAKCLRILVAADLPEEIKCRSRLILSFLDRNAQNGLSHAAFLGQEADDDMLSQNTGVQEPLVDADNTDPSRDPYLLPRGSSMSHGL